MASNKDGTCSKDPYNSGFYSNLCLDILVVLVLCRVVHSFLGRFHQPRIISELIVGVLMSYLPILSKSPLENGFRVMENVASTLYMFVLGLEMEPLAMLKMPPNPEIMIAYAGISCTMAIFLLIYCIYHLQNLSSVLNSPQSAGDTRHTERVFASFGIMFSAASSPIITRLITELKLGQSDIGRRAIRAGMANDMLCTVLMAFLIAARKTAKEFLLVLTCIFAEVLVAVSVIRLIFRWVNNRNPEGKPLKGLDMTIVVFSTQLLCHLATIFHYDAKVNSFLIGLALPRQGRVSNFLISKINYYLTAFILPLYLSMAGIKFQSGVTGGEADRVSWFRMAVISMLASLGKMLGTLLICLRYGQHWLEAITLGMILSMKGYFQVFFTMHAKTRGLMSESGMLVMLFIVMASIVYVPATVSFIIRRVRAVKGGKPRFMGLQWYNPESELRITIALQGAQNVPTSMGLMEMMRAGSEAAGMVVYAMDMIELTEENKAALVYRQGTNEVMVADNAVVELRQEIGAALDAYQEAGARSRGGGGAGEGMKLIRNLAIASFADMHDDICCSAQDSLSVFIMLPFHRSPQLDAADAGDPGFRKVNENVLKHSPCSVGILVDRGLGGRDISSTLSSSSSAAEGSLSLSLSLNVVVVFIGGADDREALAFSGIIVRHPAVRLLAIRIIPDTEAIAADGPGQRILAAMPQREMEMRVDDEYFAGFYENYITNGRVGYMEKHVKNGAEAVRVLRDLDRDHQLFVVGQGSERNSILTAGLSEWAEWPELGPIGDILSAPDFPSTASVLVIRQHDPAKDSQYISDEFMPF